MQFTQFAMFLGAFPLAYKMSGMVKPTTLAAAGLARFVLVFDGLS